MSSGEEYCQKKKKVGGELENKPMCTRAFFWERVQSYQCGLWLKDLKDLHLGEFPVRKMHDSETT